MKTPNRHWSISDTVQLWLHQYYSLYRIKDYHNYPLQKKKNPPNLHIETKFLQNLTKQNPSKPGWVLKQGTIMSVLTEGPDRRVAELGLNTSLDQGITAHASQHGRVANVTTAKLVTTDSKIALSEAQCFQMSCIPHSPPKAVKCWLTKKPPKQICF